MIYKLRFWIPLAIAVCAFSLLIYAAVQQSLRQSANDPQIQISEDLAARFSSGENPKATIAPGATDISKSLATFAIIYDNGGKEVVSSAILDGKTPVLPQGVLDFARNHNQERLTWEPKPGVRAAVVVNRYKDGFVLVGRSIREVEKREDRLEMMVGLTWIAVMLSTLVAIFLFVPAPKRVKSGPGNQSKWGRLLIQKFRHGF